MSNFFVAVDGFIEEDRLLQAYSPTSPAVHAFSFNGLQHAKKILSTAAFHEKDWSLDVLVDRRSCALEASYKAERDVMHDINGKRTTVAKGERLLVIRSGKWKKPIVAEVAQNCIEVRLATLLSSLQQPSYEHSLI